MYRKKKIDKRYLFLVVAIIFIILVALIIYVLRKERNLNPVEKVIKDACLTVSEIIYKPISVIKNKISESKDKNNLYKKYKDLEEKYSQYNSEVAKITELEKENKELKKLLDLKSTLTEYDKINATVVNRNVGYWFDTITIDKGESSGITKDMAVVTNDGLIGKVINTSYLHSTVRLLTSNQLEQKVSIKINLNDETFVYGLLSSYDTENNVFIIEGISENIDIPKGAMVTTTGMSSIFPSGILIGYVKGIKKDNFDLTMLVEVNAGYNINNINYVSVLKRISESE